MRKYHRWIGTLAAVFLIFIAASGVALQIEMARDHGGGSPAAPPRMPAAGGGALSAEEIRRRIDAVLPQLLDNARRQAPDAPVIGVQLNIGAGGGLPDQVVVAAQGPRQLFFDAATGEPATQAQHSRDLHLLLLRLHNGAFFGGAGIWLSILCGLCLLLLGITGLAVYVDMLLRRVRTGKRSAFW
jgi:hypothetical protein